MVDGLVATLTQVVGGGAGGGLEGGDGLGLLLAPFCAGQRLMLKHQEEAPGDGLPGAKLLDQPQIVLLQLTAAFVRLLGQLPAHRIHVVVDVRPLGQHLELHLDRGNLQVADKGIDDTALFPGAAEQKVDRDHLDQLDIAVISGVDDAVGDLFNRNVVGQWIDGTHHLLRLQECFELIQLSRLQIHLKAAFAFGLCFGLLFLCGSLTLQPGREHGQLLAVPPPRRSVLGQYSAVSQIAEKQQNER